MDLILTIITGYGDDAGLMLLAIGLGILWRKIERVEKKLDLHDNDTKEIQRSLGRIEGKLHTKHDD